MSSGEAVLRAEGFPESSEDTGHELTFQVLKAAEWELREKGVPGEEVIQRTGKQGKSDRSHEIWTISQTVLERPVEESLPGWQGMGRSIHIDCNAHLFLIWATLGAHS